MAQGENATANTGTLINVNVRGPEWRGRDPHSPDYLDESSDRLAEVVEEQLRQQKKHHGLHDQLLVPFSIPDRPVGHSIEEIFDSDAVGVSWAAACSSGQLDKVIQEFERLPKRRLVIVGAAGAGKTGVVINFALLLLDGRSTKRETAGRKKVAVPVVLPLGSGAMDHNESLDHWIALRLVDLYGEAFGVTGRMGRKRAIRLALRLVRTGRVLPILDGLDECAEPLQPMVVAKLNADGRPVVLTCRMPEYEKAVTGEWEDGTDYPVLHGAPVLELQSVPVEEVQKHLGRATHPKYLPKWDQVFARLQEDPFGPLVEALSTPLMVWLARIIYAHRKNDPSELLDFADCRSIEGHLLDQFIPAVYSDGPLSQFPQRGRSMKDKKAEHWLTSLAQLQQRLKTRDLAWWELAKATPPYVTGLLSGIVGCLLATLGVTLAIGISNGVEAGRALGPAGGIEAGVWAVGNIVGVGIGLGIVAGIVAAVIGWFAAKNPPSPSALMIQVQRGFKPSLRRLFDGALPGLLGALLFGAAVWLLYGIKAGVLATLVACAVAPTSTAVAWLTNTIADARRTKSSRRATHDTRPSSAFDRDRKAALWNMLMVGVIAGGLAAGIVEVLIRPTDLPPVLAAGFTTGVGFAVAAGTRMAWVHFLIAQAWLAAHGETPWRLMDFLDDAYDKNVLRQFGDRYQFRHTLHQDRLLERSEEPDLPTTHSRRRRKLRGALIVVTLIPFASFGLWAVYLQSTKRDTECYPSVALQTRTDPHFRVTVSSAHSASQPAILLQRANCVLRPSTSPSNNYQDKVDLDSGHPGHGKTKVQIGHRRDGGLAEIILERHKILTASGSPAYVKIDHGLAMDYYACRSALQATAERVNGIRNDELQKGDRLCVETSQKNIALVYIIEPPERASPRLLITFTVWDS
ncbi:hypothetical protein AB0I98_36940 [Streptomyces sp. NPDC050211]|uniref:hypothetical protein n=1 Tax=Streptomyces sp. NPDC050211 TaxID=3154932 RepID=UPI003416731A